MTQTLENVQKNVDKEINKTLRMYQLALRLMENP